MHQNMWCLSIDLPQDNGELFCPDSQETSPSLPGDFKLPMICIAQPESIRQVLFFFTAYLWHWVHIPVFFLYFTWIYLSDHKYRGLWLLGEKVFLFMLIHLVVTFMSSKTHFDYSAKWQSVTFLNSLFEPLVTVALGLICVFCIYYYTLGIWVPMIRSPLPFPPPPPRISTRDLFHVCSRGVFG